MRIAISNVSTARESLQAVNSDYNNNVWFGSIGSLPPDANGLNIDPKLMNPSQWGNGFSTLEGYKLQDGSPCIGCGKIISDSGGRDFWGNPVPAGEKPSIGAHQR